LRQRNDSVALFRFSRQDESTMRNKAIMLACFLLLCAGVTLAVDTVLTWPNDGKDPVLKFTVGKMRLVNSYSGQADYVAEALVQNLSAKPMPFASFYIYLLDKNKKRIGQGYVEVSNLAAGQQAKVPVSAHAIGQIAGMELQPQSLPSDEPVNAKVNVTSEPSGAAIKVDGKNAGFTPQMLSLLPGKHVFEFSKEGYATDSAPVDVAASTLPAAVSLQLNPLAEDTIVLRDGTTVLGDVSSVTMTAVTAKVKGKIRKFDRNQVARVIFVERIKVKTPVRTKIGKRK
jgi:PEGA domain